MPKGVDEISPNERYCGSGPCAYPSSNVQLPRYIFNIGVSQAG